MHRLARRLAGALLVVPLTVGVLPAQAAPASPGSFTGLAFDTCAAPGQATMDAWRLGSPYQGVGIYVGGANRACPQPNLTADWVKAQRAGGWRLMPLWVGPQAACSGYSTVIDAAPASAYAAARRQGKAAANQAASASSVLGVPAGSTLWYDLEEFDTLASTDCRRSALAFLSAWTTRLHALGWKAGLYGNAASVVAAVDYADQVSPSAYVETDQVWYAWANGKADTAIKKAWVRSGSWARGRVHQYVLDTTRTYGGLGLSVDESFLDVGKGSVAPKAGPHCAVRLDFATYGALQRGSTGPRVKAAQCLLTQRKVYRGKVNGTFTAATVRATRAWQRQTGLPVTGRFDRTTWTALHAAGSHPLVKRGSVGDPVRRLQRALDAAGTPKLGISGVLGASTASALAAYQTRVGLTPTGVAAPDTWAALRSGLH